jgi:hypothetical protein
MCDPGCANQPGCEAEKDDCGKMVAGTACPEAWQGDGICDLVCVNDEAGINDGGDCDGMLR